MHPILLLVFISALQVNGEKKCFAPVTCSENGSSKLEWKQIYPSPSCKLTEEGNASEAKVLKRENGIQGPPGPPGKQGPPGVANERITDELENEVQTLQKLLKEATDNNTKLSRELESLETEMKSLINSQQNVLDQTIDDVESNSVNQSQQAKTIETLQEQILSLQNRFHSDVECKIVHSKKCFWISSAPHTASTGKKFCADRGGSLANIYSSKHFEVIRRYLSNIVPDTDDYVIGMTYDSTGVKLSDGSAAPYVKWISGAPYDGDIRTVIMFESHAIAGNAGIWNAPPSGYGQGVICEKPL